MGEKGNKKGKWRWGEGGQREGLETLLGCGRFLNTNKVAFDKETKLIVYSR